MIMPNLGVPPNRPDHAERLARVSSPQLTHPAARAPAHPRPLPSSLPRWSWRRPAAVAPSLPPLHPILDGTPLCAAAADAQPRSGSSKLRPASRLLRRRLLPHVRSVASPASPAPRISPSTKDLAEGVRGEVRLCVHEETHVCVWHGATGRPADLATMVAELERLLSILWTGGARLDEQAAFFACST